MTTSLVFTQPSGLPNQVLRGPADPDHYRVRVGRYGDRWYTDPLPSCPIAPALPTDQQVAWPSVTTVKHASGTDWTYTALRRAADHVTSHPDVTQLPAAAVYEHLKTVNKTSLDEAKLRGSNVHKLVEQQLRGEPWSIPPGEPGYEYTAAVHQFLDTYQPQLVAAETVCIHRDLHSVGYGGTGDAVIRVDGATYWVDWKTRGVDSAHAAYPEEAAQLAAYATSQYMIVEGEGGARRIHPPAVDGALIVSIRPDGVRVYPVNLPAAAALWEALHAWWVARRSERYVTRHPLPPRRTPTRTPQATPEPAPEPAPAPAPAAQPAAGHSEEYYATLAQRAPNLGTLTTLYQQAAAAGAWTPQLRAVFTARKHQLQTNP